MATPESRKTGGGNSRGQVWSLDQTTLTATSVLNADMGVYSYAVGSAQPLSNGNYQFLNNRVQGSMLYAQTLEVTPTGAHNLSFDYSGFVYRVFRLTNLHTFTRRRRVFRSGCGLCPCERRNREERP